MSSLPRKTPIAGASFRVLIPAGLDRWVKEGLTPSRGGSHRPGVSGGHISIFRAIGYISPSTGTSRYFGYVSASEARLISPHSASSSYLHLPPCLPPMPNRPNAGKKKTTVAEIWRGVSMALVGSDLRESDTGALLTKLCGQDKVLRRPGRRDQPIPGTEKERLEKALEVTRLQMEEFKGQDATVEKICCQRRQLQDELVQVRARLCDLALDSDRAWEDYSSLESELQLLKGSLEHIRKVGHPQVTWQM
uniref:Uncharacterized protein n=1 Tax=Sphaerodactylus townsendi TaxID=933632 RepID=A0ACB8EVN4_9SAUR